MKFIPAKYAPTQFSTVADKTKFAMHFVKFVEAGFPKSMFHRWFYNRLSMTFCHIAHYDRGGFFDTFFSCTAGKVKFLIHTLQYGCYGDPAFTFSDVEADLRAWIHKTGQFAKWKEILSDEEEETDRRELVRLSAKYPAERAA